MKTNLPTPLLSVLCFPLLLSTAYGDSVTVYRKGHDFFVRSKYSNEYDLVIRVKRGCNESACLLAPSLPLSECDKKGIVLHAGGDEYPANAPMGRYGTLSGNHGSIFTRILTIPDHNMSEEDIGGILTDKGSKKKFVIMGIVDNNNILIHSPGRKNTIAPAFAKPSGKGLYYKEKRLLVKKSSVTQLYPMNRITKWELLADGTTSIPEDKEIKCSFVDFHFTHDVLDPYHVVQSVKNNPGKEASPRWTNKMHMFELHTDELKKKYPLYASLPALATFENRLRFDPWGAAVNYRKTTYHVQLTAVNALEVMMNWRGLMAKSTWQKFYIPKLKKLRIPHRKNKQKIYEYDFSAKADLKPAMPVSYRITRKDCLDKEDPCDRYIRLAGKRVPQYGAVLGYSLFMGCTAKGKDQTRDDLYFFWHTKKMYPYAYKLKNVKPGTVMETVAYKQFFNPQKEKDATSFYYHFQGESLIVYADFHKSLKNKLLSLPRCAAGRKITVLEKTPGLTLLTQEAIGDDAAFRINTTTGNNYIVLKLDKGNKK